jgi:hypothetical protein
MTPMQGLLELLILIRLEIQLEILQTQEQTLQQQEKIRQLECILQIILIQEVQHDLILLTHQIHQTIQHEQVLTHNQVIVATHNLHVLNHQALVAEEVQAAIAVVEEALVAEEDNQIKNNQYLCPKTS